MAYEKINRVTSSRAAHGAKFATGLGAGVASAAKFIDSYSKFARGGIYRSKNVSRKWNSTHSGKISLTRVGAKRAMRRNPKATVGLAASGIALLGTLVSTVVSAWKFSKADTQAAKKLALMTEQGDLDPSDLFMYLKSAGKREQAIICKALKMLGYDGSPTAQWAGNYKASRRKIIDQARANNFGTKRRTK